MASHVKPIPDGYHSVTPYLIVQDAAKAIDFYKQAFGATERMRIQGPGGKVVHAELGIGDSVIMMADEFPQMGAKGPRSFGGSPVTIHLYVEDVDAVVGRATAAGAKVTRPVVDQFYGDRSGGLEDPFGHSWHVATHKEDVPPDEMRRRSEAAMKQFAGQSGGH
jgi:PhnB protein